MELAREQEVRRALTGSSSSSQCINSLTSLNCLATWDDATQYKTVMKAQFPPTAAQSQAVGKWRGWDLIGVCTAPELRS